jgi:hypothetical protein
MSESEDALTGAIQKTDAFSNAVRVLEDAEMSGLICVEEEFWRPIWRYVRPVLEGAMLAYNEEVQRLRQREAGEDA